MKRWLQSARKQYVLLYRGGTQSDIFPSFQEQRNLFLEVKKQCKESKCDTKKILIICSQIERNDKE